MEKETYKTHYSSGAPSRKDEEQIKKTKLSKIETAIDKLNNPKSKFREKYKNTLGEEIFDKDLHREMQQRQKAAAASKIIRGHFSPRQASGAGRHLGPKPTPTLEGRSKSPSAYPRSLSAELVAPPQSSRSSD